MSNTSTDHLSALSDDEFEVAFAKITAEARDLGLHGFGGQCWAMAVAINRAIFDGKGVFVAGMNAPLSDTGRYIGHAAIRSRNSFWDLDGRPKEQEEIESWGMLDYGDSDYEDAFHKAGLIFTEENCYDAGAFEYGKESDVISIFALDPENIADHEAKLREIVARVLAQAPAPTA